MRLYIHVTLYLVVSVSWAFNIDIFRPQHYPGAQEDFFGYRTLQFPAAQGPRILVSAPLQGNGRGGLYSCPSSGQNCSQISLKETDPIKFLGISMAVMQRPTVEFTSCSSYMAHECHGNSYLNGVCYSFNKQMDHISKITPAYQECTTRIVNLVFLFDGSSSVKRKDFIENKIFIKKIMKTHSNSSIKFAAVQFSEHIRTVFTFKDYVEGTAENKLEKEEHMRSLTNTHRAIHFVQKSLFDEKEAGADLDAQKALVIITDGDPSDSDDMNSIDRCNKDNIIRFIIGVGNVNLIKLQKMASEPKTSNVFRIKNYKGLEGLLGQLQHKIYSIEGAKSSNIRKRELSQCGFSSIFQEDSLVLGSVGSNDWSGALYQIEKSTETEIEAPGLVNDSYMGYSVGVGKKNGQQLLFSGAPRFNHKGQIILFIKDNTKWTMSIAIEGEKIGSYFGADLCSLDVNSDGETDFLVVGAPLYHQSHPQRTGMVYVYSLSAQLKLELKLELSESSDGRFGSSVTSLQDLNGDKLRDVAVGAPTEDDQRGVIYIYLGESDKGIRPKYSQRIAARIVSPGLRQFGISLDGEMDLSGDGLTDVVVGAKGGVILLRSRHVMSVAASLTFSPAEISTSDIDCLVNEEKTLIAFNLTSCFNITQVTPTMKGAVGSALNVSYLLDLDSIRPRSRVFFNIQKKERNQTRTEALSLGIRCFMHTVFMPNCVRDTLSNIVIKLNLSQPEQDMEGADAVFNIDSSTTELVEVPFQKNCKQNERCVANLNVDFRFGQNTLLVMNQASFVVIVTLTNNGDDSYNTILILHYPPGLSLSKFRCIESKRRTLSSCGDQEGAVDRTTCSISLPVYRSQTAATFEALFRVSRDHMWNDTMEMNITASSDNNGNSSNSTACKSLPVQYAVDLDVRVIHEESVTYVNFSLSDRGPKTVLNTYEVKNNGYKGVPISVMFVELTNLHGSDISVSSSENITKCKVTEATAAPCTPGYSCENLECEEFTLEQHSSVRFTLSSRVSLNDLQLYDGRWSFYEFRLEKQFKSDARFSYDKSRYRQISSEQGGQVDLSKYHHAEMSVRVELIIPPSVLLIGLSGGAGGLILLIICVVALCKCGFFKRKNPYTEMESQVVQCGSEQPEGKTEETKSTAEDEPFLPDEASGKGESSLNDAQPTDLQQTDTQPTE